MNYLLTGICVILLIIVTVMLVIFMPKPKCYFDPVETSIELLLLTNDDHFTNITDECNKIDDCVIYDEQTSYNKEIQITNTYELLRTIPNVKHVHIYTLDKKTSTTKSKGDAYTNDILRVILPINACNSRKSYVWCDGEKRLFSNGKLIIYDPSRESQMINDHRRQSTRLLIIDIARPDNVPKGVA